ncbi:MAG: DNA polymerase III subunit gamma/tau [Clostridia bacterium]|nr:DNA polymerase III subunit gamma/tau [Clostridia bacterium]
MHQALYRKYRPRSFDDVCGEEHVTSVLRYEAKMSRFSHAYLFCGPRGTGKTTCAKILAKVLNCEHPENGNPCGKCFACTSIDSGNAADVLEMDAASNNGVEYIRDIRDEVNYTPAALNRRVYIIDEVHMLSVSAFNALLKTLEEPPEHVVFILATTELHKLPATIISRCQRFDFRRIKTDVIASRLLQIAGWENLSLTPDAAKILAKQSQGGMRDAISLFELCAAGGHEVTAERVSDILGLTGTELLYKTAVAVARSDGRSIFNIIQLVGASSKDIAVYWSELTEFWRDMLVCKYLGDEEKAAYLDLTEPELRVLNDAARRFSKETLSRHFELLDDALREMTRLPQAKRITAELTLMKMSDASLNSSAEALLSRIAALEEKVSLLEAAPPAAVRTAEIAPSAAEEITVSPEPVPVTAVPETTAEPVSAPAASESLLPVNDLGDVIERVVSQNPRCSGFLDECDCFVTPDRQKVVIRTGNNFAKTVLTGDSSMQSLRSALHACGISGVGAEVIVEVGAVQKKRPPMDELTDI